MSSRYRLWGFVLFSVLFTIYCTLTELPSKLPRPTRVRSRLPQILEEQNITIHNVLNWRWKQFFSISSSLSGLVTLSLGLMDEKLSRFFQKRVIGFESTFSRLCLQQMIEDYIYPLNSNLAISHEIETHSREKFNGIHM